jgi:catechol 2,3-dioxygenase-like lactoylglutathione lyase family enzyme
MRVLIPTFVVRDMREAIAFHTEVLDFSLAFAMDEAAPFYAVLTRGADELHLSLHSGRGPCGHGSAIVVCDQVDALFATFRARGLSPPTRADSPVHEAPLDQTWGFREVYIDDPSGNTLCFQQR